MSAPRSSIAAHATPPTRSRWWLGVLSAPLGWLFVEGVGYVVSARECSRRVDIDTTHIRVTQLVICGIGLIAAVNGLRVSLSQHRALRATTGGADTPMQGRRRFMAASGVILSTLFIGGIVLFAINALFVDVCERAR
jgi:hypothetical protein